MGFFSNAVRLIRRKKDSQVAENTFDILDNLPEAGGDIHSDSMDVKDGPVGSGIKSENNEEGKVDVPIEAAHKVTSSTVVVGSNNSLSNAWTTALPDTPVQSDFRPVFRSEAFSTRINSKRFISVPAKDSLRDASSLNVPAFSKGAYKSFWTVATQLFKFNRDQNVTDNSDIPDTKQPRLQEETKKQTKIHQDADVTSTNLEFDFSLRNYGKESFSVMIVNPISKCMHKILRASYFAITGVLVGSLIALIACLITLQFGAVENSVISAYLIDKIESMFPNSDFSVKSAKLQWNSEAGSVEVCLNRVRFGEFFIPRVTILPNYVDSLKRGKLVTDTVSLVKPKVTLHIADDFKTIFINPNFLKARSNKAVFEPFSTVVEVKDWLVENGMIHENATLKLVNADISVVENGVSWDAKNLYCEYKLGDLFPRILDFSSVLPGQKYSSSVRVSKFTNSLGYDLKINSLNPAIIYEMFIERSSPIEKFLPIIQGYNLPVSGDAQIFLNSDQTFKNCSFNILASKGTVRLPNRNSLALNLGKRIDNGSISGTITKDSMSFDTINISYGNSGVQLTGLRVPINNSNLIDTGSVDGTLSLTNVNLDEVYGILPKGMSEPVFSVFHDYMPGFRLDLLKFDIKGPVTFGENVKNDNLLISQGIFKIRGAQIPINNELMATEVDATGTVKSDGLDVKVSSAKFGRVKINSGVFFVSNKDESWIAKINANLPVDELLKYVPNAKLEFLPFEISEIGETAKVDAKLVRLAKDNFEEKVLPFNVTEGSGLICSEDSSRKLRFSWNKDGRSIVTDLINGKHNTHLEATEDAAQKTGTAQLHCIGNSSFLANMVPFISKDLKGDFDLTLNKAWDESGERADLSIDLANATLNLPVVGSVKGLKESGTFKAHIQKYPDRITLSQIVLETPKTKISGHVTTDTNWNITECVLDSISMDGISARANVFKKDDKKLILSIVGDSFDAHKLTGLLNQAKYDVKLVTYLNMKELHFNGNILKNIKGTVDILGGRIVDGSCIGVLGNSTLALNVKSLDGSDDHLVSISSSDAEKFLKTFGIGNSVDGGTITFNMKSSDIAKGIISGDFEMNNFLVKNNLQLMRLITLSSPNYMNGMHVIIGFNTCSGHLTLEDGKVKVENLRAISPTIALSLSGEYDRLNDEMSGSGMVLPTSSLNSITSEGCSASSFTISGSFWNPGVSVDPSQIVDLEALRSAFGSSVPQLNNTAMLSENTTILGKTVNILPASEEFTTVKIRKGTPGDADATENGNDAYANESFDKDAAVEERKERLLQLALAQHTTAIAKRKNKIKNNWRVKMRYGKKKNKARDVNQSL